MIVLFLFGFCFFGFGDCGEPDYIQDIEELKLELVIDQLDVTMNDYVGDGCLQTQFENPVFSPDVSNGHPGNYGKVYGSQGWSDGKLWRNLNGTLLTETFCSYDVWNVFEDWKKKPDVDFHKGDVYYDGEWLRYNQTAQQKTGDVSNG